MNLISTHQHNRVKFLATEKGAGPIKSDDVDFNKYPAPSMLGTEMVYRKKDN